MKSQKKIPCIRLWTGEDLESHFEEGSILLTLGNREDFLSGEFPAVKTSFQETVANGLFEWHVAPARQLVVTLSGILRFEMRDGKHFELSPGKILLAEDTKGGGHQWKLVGDDPWRRIYIVLQEEVILPFQKDSSLVD